MWVAAKTHEEALEKASKKFNIPVENIILEQDEDVLDTWFSSALLPFSVYGWPDMDSKDLKAFYPGHLLETGSDILFFWVARMCMMGIFMMEKPPFKNVYLHQIVRDEDGEKMSKSKGNVIDPLDVIDGATLDKILEVIQQSALNEKEVKEAIEKKKKVNPLVEYNNNRFSPHRNSKNTTVSQSAVLTPFVSVFLPTPFRVTTDIVDKCLIQYYNRPIHQSRR